MINKKRKIKTAFLIFAVTAALCLSGCSAIRSVLPANCGGSVKNEEAAGNQKKVTPVYLASTGDDVPVYHMSVKTDENGKEVRELEVYEKMNRGSEVFSRDNTANFGTEEEQDIYLEIQLDDADPDSVSEVYYIRPEAAAVSRESSVLEKDRYVRTSVTLYENEKGADIASFVKKGSHLKITGFDGLKDDGTVEKYNVETDDGTSGWVYAKYLAETQEQADAIFSSIARIHEDRIYKDLDLKGGLPSNLDWYPYARTEIEGKEIPEEAKTMYLCAEAVVNNSGYLDLIKSHGINAVVIDIKDGQLAYESEVASELSPTSYEKAFVSVDEYKNAVEAFHSADVYTIGRIVCFSDEYYAADHPETCIESPESTRAWPSAYSREAWEYNVKLALEAVETMGFDEIQFDYVRFPENAYSMSNNPDTDYKNEYDEDKAEAIQNFCFYAADTIHEAGAYFSVDVFGESADEYVSAYGQYWPAISNIVDAISGMPYTDHYGPNEDTWSEPYEIVHTFAELAAKRQEEIATPAIVRTWVTGYDTPNWEPVVDYDETKMIEQINALYDCGLDGGFIPWNGGSNINKYQEYAGIWDKTYPTDADAVGRGGNSKDEETTESGSDEDTTADGADVNENNPDMAGPEEAGGAEAGAGEVGQEVPGGAEAGIEGEVPVEAGGAEAGAGEIGQEVPGGAEAGIEGDVPVEAGGAEAGAGEIGQEVPGGAEAGIEGDVPEEAGGAEAGAGEAY